MACPTAGEGPQGQGLSTRTQVGLSLHGPPRTFSYILRELPKVPTHVPVCVLGNYRDMGEHRVILPDDVRDLIDSLDRWVLSGTLQVSRLGHAPGPPFLASRPHCSLPRT